MVLTLDLADTTLAAYKGSLRSTLTLFGDALRQHPDDFRDMLEAVSWNKAEIEGAGSCESVAPSGSSLTPAESWQILGKRRWWSLERPSMAAIFAHNLVLELMASHRAHGGVSEQLQWVCQNLGQFVRQYAELRGPVVAGLALALEDLEKKRSPLPEYLVRVLDNVVGMEASDRASGTLEG